MKLAYKNGTINVFTEGSSHVQTTFSCRVEVDDIVKVTLRFISRDRFIFFEKTPCKYNRELEMAVSSLIADSKVFIDGINRVGVE